MLEHVGLVRFIRVKGRVSVQSVKRDVGSDFSFHAETETQSRAVKILFKIVARETPLVFGMQAVTADPRRSDQRSIGGQRQKNITVCADAVIIIIQPAFKYAVRHRKRRASRQGSEQ